MNATAENTPSADTRGPRTPLAVLRRELIVLGVLAAIGFLLLPMAVYLVGQQILGDYSTDGRGIWSLYGHVYGDLASGSMWAWLLCLSPWLTVTLVRLLWKPLRWRPAPRTSPADDGA